jgi:large subunit ribosomal protein L32
MAVPKRKTPRAKTRSRRAANWRLDAPARSLCPNCGATKLPHVVCSNCGWYRGRAVIDVD